MNGTFRGAVKPPCPCDAGKPQDCRAEDWPGAHAPSVCLDCGCPNYQHGGLVRCPRRVVICETDSAACTCGAPVGTPGGMHHGYCPTNPASDDRRRGPSA